MDESSHFSVRDSVQIAGVPVTSFRHLDPDDLAAQLHGQLRPGERPLVISDGVFPISGEIAPVPDYLAALASYPGAILCLDDAHATGVLGRGTGDGGVLAGAGPDRFAEPVRSAGDQRAHVEQGARMPRRRSSPAMPS